ncbi:MAG: ComF family protein [Elusimicrobia bacterium]|nr:ComF family protein [Elusimicrobiota bacterium]
MFHLIRRITAIFKKIIIRAMDFVFPTVCPGCGKFIADGDAGEGKIVCGECFEKIKYVDGKICLKCGLPCPGDSCPGDLCDSCEKPRTEIYYTYLRGACVYNENLSGYISSFKYRGKEYLSEFLGNILNGYLEKHPEMTKVDAVVPVPLHWRKWLARGYNQSELLSARVAKRFNIKLDPGMLERKRWTRPQAKLTRQERFKNTDGAFEIKSGRQTAGKNILLIDDVSTTGETINQCAMALKNKGAGNVYGLVVARDLPERPAPLDISH